MQKARQREHFYDNAETARTAVRDYRSRLRALADAVRRRGEQPTDQSYPEEVFVLRPRHTTAGPLMLLGGMGPMAGADGFAAACARFGNTRQIVLMQACSVPCRTSVLLAEAGRTPTIMSDARRRVLGALRDALRRAVDYLEGDEPASLVILCNTAHAFLPDLEAMLRRDEPLLAARVRTISLVESSVAALKAGGFHRTLALCTTGSRAGRLYARRFDEEGIGYLEPPAALDAMLMRSIVHGVKAFDEDISAAAGCSFFRDLLRREPEVDAVLAGCTEIPRVMRSVMRCGDASVRRFLERVTIVDPCDAALATL